MTRILIGLAAGLVVGVIGLIIQRRRRSELDREARRIASLGSVDSHRERYR